MVVIKDANHKQRVVHGVLKAREDACRLENGSREWAKKAKSSDLIYMLGIVVGAMAGLIGSCIEANINLWIISKVREVLARSQIIV